MRLQTAPQRRGASGSNAGDNESSGGSINNGGNGGSSGTNNGGSSSGGDNTDGGNTNIGTGAAAGLQLPLCVLAALAAFALGLSGLSLLCQRRFCAALGQPS
jgi:hypothetical protein